MGGWSTYDKSREYKPICRGKTQHVAKIGHGGSRIEKEDGTEKDRFNGDEWLAPTENANACSR